MPQIAITLDNDTIDLVVFRTIGVVNEALLQETHDLNPSIANYGATMPYGVSVIVPDKPADAQQIKRGIKLYD